MLTLCVCCSADMKSTSSKLSMNLNYVSDPAGSKQLDGAYGMDDGGNTKLVLERYQLSTDENTPKL
jgi:hypothetical protein